MRTVRPTDPLPEVTHRSKVCAYLDAFLGKCHYFRNDDPYRQKLNRSLAHGRHASACQISPSYDAAFRRSLETEKINRLSII